MSIQLLEVVQAEQSAEALVQLAQEAHETVIKQVLIERERALANVKAPVVNVPELAPLRPNLLTLQETALANREKVIKRILEEIYAA